MPELPVLTARQVVKTLTVLGLVIIRQRGSHPQMKRGNRLVMVPMHRGDVPVSTLKSILREASIDI